MFQVLFIHIQTTLRVVENLGGRVFPLLGAFPLLGMLWNRHFTDIKGTNEESEAFRGGNDKVSGTD